MIPIKTLDPVFEFGFRGDSYRGRRLLKNDARDVSSSIRGEEIKDVLPLRGRL